MSPLTFDDKGSKDARDECIALGIHPFRCLCDHVCHGRMSFNDDNPGRRWVECRIAPGSIEGGCSFHQWVDEEFTSHSVQCINHLLDVSEELKRQLREKEDEIEELKKEVASLKKAASGGIPLKAAIDDALDEWK